VVGGCIKCFDFRPRVGERGGSIGSTQGRTSRRFPVVEASHRASLVRVGTWSRRSVRGLAWPSWAEPLAWFSQGFVFLNRLNVGTPGLGTRHCKVRMARGGVNSLFKNLQASLNNHVSIKEG
jgi:hypothetical protein